jgi:hypothetical protein
VKNRGSGREHDGEEGRREEGDVKRGEVKKEGGEGSRAGFCLGEKQFFFLTRKLRWLWREWVVCFPCGKTHTDD